MKLITTTTESMTTIMKSRKTTMRSKTSAEESRNSRKDAEDARRTLTKTETCSSSTASSSRGLRTWLALALTSLPATQQNFTTRLTSSTATRTIVSTNTECTMTCHPMFTMTATMNTIEHTSTRKPTTEELHAH